MANNAKHPATTTTTLVHRVKVLVPVGVLPLDLVVPVTAFSRWGDHVYDVTGLSHHPYEVALVGEASTPSDHMAAGHPVLPLSELTDADTVVVPGTANPLRPVDPTTLESLRDAHAQGTRIVSICTGAFILAAAGLLDGRPATTHWVWAQRLRELYPHVQVLEDQLYVDTGDVITSAGMLAGVDCCLHILRIDHGQLVANTVARFLVSAPHREGGQAQFIHGVRPVNDGGDTARISNWILSHLAEPLTLDLIAKHTHTSVRTLSRRFKAANGSSVMDWIIAQRVAKARALLETTDLSISEVSSRAGFATPESLRSHFTERTHNSPSRYRTAFQ